MSPIMREGDRRGHDLVDHHHADRDDEEEQDGLDRPDEEAAEQRLTALRLFFLQRRPGPRLCIWKKRCRA
jgi:hypothetical protein